MNRAYHYVRADMPVPHEIKKHVFPEKKRKQINFLLAASKMWRAKFSKSSKMSLMQIACNKKGAEKIRPFAKYIFICCAQSTKERGRFVNQSLLFVYPPQSNQYLPDPLHSH